MIEVMISDARFNSLTALAGVLFTAIPAILAVYYSKAAKKNSEDAKQNSEEAKQNSEEAKQNSAAAKENSEGALHEVKANGGMSDPDPTLKDYIKFVGDHVITLSARMNTLEEKFDTHIDHSNLMDNALATVYNHLVPATVNPKDLELPPLEPDPPGPFS